VDAMKSFILVVALAIVAGGMYFAFDFFKFANTASGLASEEEVFEVPTGSNFHKVSAQLKEKNLITDGFKFRLFAKFTGQQNYLKKGEYMLNHGMTPQAILDVLKSGKSIQYPVTFPEGSNIYDMAAILDARGLYKGDEFLKTVKDPAFVKKTLGFDAPSLEGYLFPETYNVTKFTTLKELANMMVARFNDAYKTLAAESSTKLSEHEIVTLASVVEKETGAPEERPLIASVFYNRMSKGIPLQSDPTILYGMIDATGKPSQNITKADITRPTRYNTYTVKRLPYGPIANPGREALAAALKPATSEFFYFVSKNQGTHLFTKTYAEHLKGVKSFQVDPSAREGKSWRDLKKRTATSPKQ
jgi:UPF0755 protein